MPRSLGTTAMKSPRRCEAGLDEPKSQRNWLLGVGVKVAAFNSVAFQFVKEENSVAGRPPPSNDSSTSLVNSGNPPGASIAIFMARHEFHDPAGFDYLCPVLVSEPHDTFLQSARRAASLRRRQSQIPPLSRPHCAGDQTRVGSPTYELRTGLLKTVRDTF